MSRLTIKTAKLLALAFIAPGFVFTNSAYAFIAGESHACTADSETGGSWLGGYYYPGARSAATVMRNQQNSGSVNLYINLLAYSEMPISVVGHEISFVTTPPGTPNNQVVVSVTDPQSAPGYNVALHYAWSPVLTKFAGTNTYLQQSIDANGCRNRVLYL